MKTLEEMGYKIITPDEGYLACGYTGKGRLPEPETLVEYVEKELSPKDLKGKKVLVTAGPTREKLDPIRFLSNYSSGKMGYALARAASYRGADVTLVSGPTDLKTPIGVDVHSVESASEMKKEVLKNFDSQDMVFMAAAVADYRPKSISHNKIKKSDSKAEIELMRTDDILMEMGKKKREDQLLVGFAAETENIINNASIKLKKKNADYIIANDVSSNDSGIASDFNRVTILSNTEKKELPLKNKDELADDIIDYIKP